MRRWRGPSRRQGGFALALTMVIISVGMMTLAGVLLYCHVSGLWVQRSTVRSEALAAAEAASEAVLTEIQQDFRTGGDSAVSARLGFYSLLTPPVIQGGVWDGYDFLDDSWTLNRLTITSGQQPEVKLDERSLPTNAPTYAIESYVRRPLPTGSNVVTAGVRQKVTLLEVPLADFGCYYNIDLELDPWHDWTTYGRVHSNAKCYFKPTADAVLTFMEEVSAAGGIVHGDNPLNPGGGFNGTIDYQKRRTSGAGSFSMPVGNTGPEARRLIEIPPGGEDANGLVGRSRFYNRADLIVRVYDGSIDVRTSVGQGLTPVSTGTNFILANVPIIWDAREGKNVRLTAINVGWGTNSLATKLPALNTMVTNPNGVQTIYVADLRTTDAFTMNAVMIWNGGSLPANGLCIASPNPVYVRGHFNSSPSVPNARPAMIAADAITLLSWNWITNGVYGSGDVDYRNAASTTFNFVAVTGIVPTASGAGSGSAYNALRLLEDWGGRTITYNGALCVLFESQVATESWYGTAGIAYKPPQLRNYGFGRQFTSSTASLPGAPIAYAVLRTGYQVLGPPPS